MMTRGTQMFVALGMAAPLLVLPSLLSGCSLLGESDAPVLAPDYGDGTSGSLSGTRGDNETIDLGDLGDLTAGGRESPYGTEASDMPLEWDDPSAADTEGDNLDDGLADDMGEPEADWDTEGDAWTDDGYESLDDAIFDGDYDIEDEDGDTEEVLDADYEEYGDAEEWYE